MRLTMREKQSLTDLTGLRYRKARKTEKAVILNGFCENTGRNRKYAIGLLINAGRIQTQRPGTLLKQRIPVHTFRRRDDKKPGFTVADTVSHCGGLARSGYDFTLSLPGTGVINRHLRARSGKRRINFTCGRQYHKNDNACAGQKNGGIIRKTVWHGRSEGDSDVCSVMNDSLRLFLPEPEVHGQTAHRCEDAAHLREGDRDALPARPGERGTE